MHGWMNDIQ